MSGVPQGSVLGPQLFTLYIDDLEEETECIISRFADDTKLDGRMSCEEDAEMLQCDLARLCVWASAWQMQYNVDKCEVFYFGSNNRKTDYYLNGCKLREVDTQQELGVLISAQVQQAVKKANGMLAFIARGFEYRNRDILLHLPCICPLTQPVQSTLKHHCILLTAHPPTQLCIICKFGDIGWDSPALVISLRES